MATRKTQDPTSRTLGRRAFLAICAVDGLKPSAASTRRMAEMDAKGLSPAERRAEILRFYRSKNR